MGSAGGLRGRAIEVAWRDDFICCVGLHDERSANGDELGEQGIVVGLPVDESSAFTRGLALNRWRSYTSAFFMGACRERTSGAASRRRTTSRRMPACLRLERPKIVGIEHPPLSRSPKPQGLFHLRTRSRQEPRRSQPPPPVQVTKPPGGPPPAHAQPPKNPCPSHQDLADPPLPRARVIDRLGAPDEPR